MKKYQNTLLGYGHGEHTEMWEEREPPPEKPKKDWIVELILFVLFTALSILMLKILSNL